jgi:hypothetical protein
MNKLIIINSPDGGKSLDITNLHLTEEDKRTLEEWTEYKVGLHERQIIELLKSFDSGTTVGDLIPVLMERKRTNE